MYFGKNNCNKEYLFYNKSQDPLLIEFNIYIKMKTLIYPLYATMRYKTLQPTYCHCGNPKFITATIHLHIIQ